MASSRRRRTRKPRRTKYKNEEKPVNLAFKSATSTDDSPESCSTESNSFDHVSSNGCSTPKGPRFQIPRILTCPPAPKKRRVLSDCSLKRVPIAFFAPPDIELFFLFALRDSVA
ncbi:hypothetical protein Acr_26g0014400 [Actinidia rufa]|uniref:Cyclin-dependent protein kinase inhibitor SMR13 n=1 Tax=Actinidia rufa TaxID=165716 RepID=A0A7J0H566_9ERIC|nr:hypothetical protein Acr_26g0014400 [Actinidia rufa]